MPRRRMSGAAVVFLLAIMVAPSAGAADERIVPDQDISDLSREEQIAYLILNDQLSDLRELELRLSETGGNPDWAPMFCIAVGDSKFLDNSVDPSDALLGALRKVQSMQEPAYELVTASACDQFVRNLPRERTHGVTVIVTDAPPPKRVAEDLNIDTDSGRYYGRWYPHFLLTEGFCTGICLGGAFYEVHKEGVSISLTRVSTFWD